MFNVNRCTLLGSVWSNTVSFDQKTKRSVFILETRKATQNKQAAESERHVIVCHTLLARFAKDRLSKGTPVYIEGHLSTLKTGESVIVADRLVLLSKKC